MWRVQMRWDGLNRKNCFYIVELNKQGQFLRWDEKVVEKKKKWKEMWKWKFFTKIELGRITNSQ